DEDAIAVNPCLLIHGNKAVCLGKSARSVEAEPSINFCGDPSRNNLEDLTAETHEELFHAGFGACRWVGGALTGMADGFLQKVLVFGHLGRLIDERGVCGGVLRLVLADGLDVAGVGHDGGVALEGIEQVHCCCLPELRVRSTWINIVCLGRLCSD